MATKAKATRYLTDKVAYTKIAESEVSSESEEDEVDSEDAEAEQAREEESPRSLRESPESTPRSNAGSKASKGTKGSRRSKVPSAGDTGGSPRSSRSAASSARSARSGTAGSSEHSRLSRARTSDGSAPASAAADEVEAEAQLETGERSAAQRASEAKARAARVASEARARAQRAARQAAARAQEAMPNVCEDLSIMPIGACVCCAALFGVGYTLWYLLWCTVSAWSPWSDCRSLAPPPPYGAAPCGPGRQHRRREWLHGRCGGAELEEEQPCDLGACQIPDFLSQRSPEFGSTATSVLPCGSEQRSMLLASAAATFPGPVWSEVLSCVGAYFCCHPCAQVLSGDVPPLQCVARHVPPQPVFTPAGCLTCFVTDALPACGGKTVCHPSKIPGQKWVDGEEPCCVEVTPAVERKKHHMSISERLHIPLDDKAFLRRPNCNAFLGKLENPYEWPTEGSEADCQRACWEDTGCYLYTYIANTSMKERWRQRCVTWDRLEADAFGRSIPSAWIPEAGAFSGSKKAVVYSDVVVTVEAAPGSKSGSKGPFVLYVCGGPGMCVEHSPIELSDTTCQAGVGCLEPGHVHEFLATVALPDDFDLHAIRVDGLTDDTWVISKIIVDLDGQVGAHKGPVSVSRGEPLRYFVGCVVTGGWRSNAIPGTACLTKCWPGYGEYGWCWTDKDKTQWGSCARSCKELREVATNQTNAAMSTMSCAELNWPSWSPFNSDHRICSASNAHPLRACSGGLSWEAAKQFCEAVGARLCTAAELKANEAAGTGCGYDRLPVWSSTACPNGYLALPGMTGHDGNVHEHCTQTSEMSTHARCCADAREIEISFTKEHRDGHLLPPSMSTSSIGNLAEWQVVAGENHAGQEGFFLQSGMLDDQAPDDDASVDIILDDVPVAKRGGEIEFWFKVDSEPQADKLRFFIDGREQDSGGFPASGHVDWNKARFAFPSLQSEELHSFRWSYQKDASFSSGRDVACIDRITVYGVIGK